MPLYTIETNGQLHPHLGQEWLLANGLGGYGASTVVGCNTRRYHGLLCAATNPPVGRIMTLARLGEILIVDGNADRLLEFSVNQFKDTFHPRGDRYLRRFELNDVARFEYDVEGVRVTKEILVPWMTNAVGVRYTVEAAAGRDVELQLLPFVNLRDFHGTRRASTISFPVRAGERSVLVEGGPVPLHVQSDAGTFTKQTGWWYDHTYRIETDRGLDDTEDLFTPGRFTLQVKGTGTITIWAALESPALRDWDEELARRRETVSATCCVPEPKSLTIKKLERAANDFVVTRKSPDGSPGTSILAGYPWFADWGRDTFIALPGLLLVPRRFEQARQVLGVFARYVSEGMIPNRFDDYTNEPHYNTVDASLWFIHSAFEYTRASGDTQTFETILQPACRAIINGYRKGTRFNIRVDPADGLVTQGDHNTQLTWMDAKCNGISFTPRQGKAVEINALWYHALMLTGEKSEAARVRGSFVKTFWISPFRGLADVVNEHGRDASLRPNQIFAVSLPNSPLDADQQAAVVEVVRRELLTPVGLRSLAVGAPKYHAKYGGTRMVRAEAYHTGTIWSWPIGPFLEAYLRVNDRSEPSVKQAREWLAPLLRHLDDDACIGQIS